MIAARASVSALVGVTTLICVQLEGALAVDEKGASEQAILLDSTAVSATRQTPPCTEPRRASKVVHSCRVLICHVNNNTLDVVLTSDVPLDVLCSSTSWE